MIKGEGMTEMITIQPKQRADGVLPYPFHIQIEDTGDAVCGAVGRQDVWNGKPARLVGFVSDENAQRIDLDLPGFLAEPQKALGQHPVMQDSEGNWATYAGAIERVQPWTTSENEQTFVKVPEGAEA
jgi:hypothetical protein